MSEVNSEEVVDKVNKLVTQKKINTLMILSYELDAERPVLSISELSKFSQSIVADETYHLDFI